MRRDARSRTRPAAALAAAVLIAVTVACDGPGPVAVTSPSVRTIPPATSPLEGTTSDHPVPAPRFQLPSGYQLLDIRTGETTRLSRKITSIRGAGNFEISPDGSKILFDNSAKTTASNRPVRLGYHQVFVANIGGSAVRQLTHDPVGASDGSWSPDGRQVVYLGGWARQCCYGAAADLMVMDLETGATRRLADGRAMNFQEPFFAPAGDRILFSRVERSGNYLRDQPQDDLWSIPLAGGRPTFLLEDRAEAQLSPDGRSILYPRTVYWTEGRFGGAYHELWLSNADGRHRRRLASPTRDRLDAWTAAGWAPSGERIAYSHYLRGGSDPVLGVFLLDMRTGRRTLLTYGRTLEWVDDRTLIVRSRPAETETGA